MTSIIISVPHSFCKINGINTNCKCGCDISSTYVAMSLWLKLTDHAELLLSQDETIETFQSKLIKNSKNKDILIDIHTFTHTRLVKYDPEIISMMKNIDIMIFTDNIYNGNSLSYILDCNGIKCFYKYYRHTDKESCSCGDILDPVETIKEKDYHPNGKEILSPCSTDMIDSFNGNSILMSYNQKLSHVEIDFINNIISRWMEMLINKKEYKTRS